MNEVIAQEIRSLFSRGVTMEHIKQVHSHYLSKLPEPGTKVLWMDANIECTVLPNYSNVYRTDEGYIRIRNKVGTEIYLLPHEYELVGESDGN